MSLSAKTIGFINAVYANLFIEKSCSAPESQDRNILTQALDAINSILANNAIETPTINQKTIGVFPLFGKATYLLKCESTYEEPDEFWWEILDAEGISLLKAPFTPRQVEMIAKAKNLKIISPAQFFEIISQKHKDFKMKSIK